VDGQLPADLVAMMAEEPFVDDPLPDKF